MVAFVASASALSLRRNTLPKGMVVALDKDMKTQMLVQSKSTVKQLPNCEHSTCGDLKCPVGFFATEYPGHCCPYCVNPNIKVERSVNTLDERFAEYEYPNFVAFGVGRF